MRSLIAFVIVAGLAGAAAQTAAPDAAQSNPAPTTSRQVTFPAGTDVLLQLKSSIDTRNARVADCVHCHTTFPVAIDNAIAIPAGIYWRVETVTVHDS